MTGKLETTSKANKRSETKKTSGHDGLESRSRKGTSPLTRREIRKALNLPRRSVSIGSTSWGELHRATRIPLRGPSYRFFPHIKERETHYATRELSQLIRRVARKVAREHKGTELRLGNAGYKSGKKIPWSVSHQSGRDIDIAIFATDRRGKPKSFNDYVTFNSKGQAAKGSLRLDLKRNLSLVRALVEDTKTPVQWIFVYRPLKEKILDYARRSKVPEDVLERLEAVMRQPSDSSPHKDHFHVRIFCSVHERLHGCQDRPPFHPWVNRGDEVVTERTKLLLRISRSSKASNRRAAIDKLRVIRAASATPRFIEALRDSERMVRRAAWAALRSLGTDDDVPGILGVLKESPDPKQASAFFSLLTHIRSSGVRDIAQTMLEKPETYLHPDAIRRGRKNFNLSAIEILRKSAKKAEASVLLPFLESKDAEIRHAAHQALRLITNQRVRGNIRTRNAKRRAAVVKQWKTFFKEQGGESWLQWQRLGFEARGFVFEKKMMSPASVPTLIRAIGHREDEISINAIRVLGELTGHLISPKARSKRNSVRHWKSWWRDHKSRFPRGT